MLGRKLILCGRKQERIAGGCRRNGWVKKYKRSLRERRWRLNGI